MKKKFTILFSTLSLIILFFSCNTSELREVSTNNKFKMQVPKFMRSQKSLNEVASMVYANGVKELYIMVLENPIEQLEQDITDNDLDDVIDIGLDGFSQLVGIKEGESFLTPADLDKLKETTINGLKTKWFEDTRKINEVDIYYKIALIEGKDTYYQVIAWTLADRKNKNKELIDKMVQSFKELQ